MVLRMEDNLSPYLTIVETAEPAAPDAGQQRLYVDPVTHILMITDSAGAQSAVGSGAVTRASLGLATSDSPEFAGLNIGAATDTTLSRASAGVLNVEGNRIFAVGGADVPIADGGTGASTASTAFNALSPMTTSGDIIYGGASGAGTRLAKGSDTQVLTLASGLPSWATPASGFSDPMTTRGDVIVRNASNVTARLAIGTSGKVLSSDGTDISWQTPASGFSDPMSTRGDIIVRNSSNATARLAVGASANMALRSDGTDVGYAVIPGTLLGTKVDSTNRDFTNTTSLAAIDTTNLRCTVTVPASGNVIVRLGAEHVVNTSSTVADQYTTWGVMVGSTKYPTTTGAGIVFRPVAGSATVQYFRGTVSILITGLTPGSTNFDWAGMTSGGQTARITGSYTLMEVYAA